MATPKRARSSSAGANSSSDALSASCRSSTAAPRKSAPSSPAGAPDKPPPASATTRATNGEPVALGKYDPTNGIKFYDEEVARMHTELEKRDRESRSGERSVARRPRKASSGITFKGFFARVAVLYLLIAVFFVCPSDPSRSRAVCRSLDSFTSTIQSYEPHYRPYLKTAEAKITPYIRNAQAKAEPYLSQVRPHYHRTSKFVRPHFRTAVKFYRTQVYPRLIAFVHASQEATKPYMEVLRQNYRKTLAPSVEWYSKAGQDYYSSKVAPHVDVARKHGKHYGNKAYDTLSPVYTVGLPFASQHYFGTVVPFARSTYKTSKTTYVNQIHPRAVVVGGHAKRFYLSKIVPAAQRFWSLYIAPQVDKITEKIFEYKTKKEEAEAVAAVAEEEAKLAKANDVDSVEELLSEKDDAHYAQDPSASAPSSPEATLSASELKARTAAKRVALETLQSTYEKQIAKLGSVSQSLLVDRLVDIRRTAVEDIPKRFGPVLVGLDEEGDKQLGKLGKFFSRTQAAHEAGGDAAGTVDDDVLAAEVVSDTAKGKVESRKVEALKEVEGYEAYLSEKEENAVKKASEAVSELVAKAQEELSFGWTWLDDVKNSDWNRFHKLAKAEGNWKQYYLGIQSGSISEDALSSYQPSVELASVRKEIEDTVSAFTKVLEKIKTKGVKELRGDWTLDLVGAKLGGAVEAVKSSASSLVGVTTTPTLTDVMGSASSYASVASASASVYASSVYEAVPGVPTAVADTYSHAQEGVGAVVGQVQSGLDSAVTAVPEGLANVISMASSLGAAAGVGAASSLSSLGGVVSEYAEPHTSFTTPSTPIASRVADAYGDASQKVFRAVGQEPSPTDVRQSVTSLANVAARSASSLAAQASSSAESIASAVSASASSLSKEGYAAEASKSAHSAAVLASRSASSIASQASRSASSVASQASKSASSFAAEISVKRAAIQMSRSASSVASVASRSASSLAQAASSVIVDAGAKVSHYGDPHPSFKKSQVEAQATGVFQSLTDSVKSVVHDKTRTTPEGFTERVAAATEAAKKAASSIAAHVEL